MASPELDHAHAAILALCAEAPLVDRLSRAYDALSRVACEAVPDGLKARFSELLADLTYGADTVPDALRQMSAPDREVLAGRVATFYGLLATHRLPDA